LDIPSSVIDLIRRSIEEDLGHGDITTRLVIPDESESRALFIAKDSFILAGFPFAKEVFSILDPAIVFKTFYKEGDRARKGSVLGEVIGRTHSILAGERVSLNMLQRLSGIATRTRQFVDAVSGLKTRIVDTRKTIPGHRFMEKYAVRMGGGGNHRFGLYDGILIKDNHIESVGSLKEAVQRAKAGNYLAKIEVEVESLKDVKEAIEAGADIVMLDNMSVEDMRKAVRIAHGKIKTEASGNITLRKVREIAETGVDLISVGALTHSVRAADISMKIVG
jgi:nicotinate-nucleotide pyrophosphorylase (carboxylating)